MFRELKQKQEEEEASKAQFSGVAETSDSFLENSTYKYLFAEVIDTLVAFTYRDTSIDTTGIPFGIYSLLHAFAAEEQVIFHL